jgi:predicted ribosomally synthesized peptide with nif11-like leader
MSTKELGRFYEEVIRDKRLQEQLKGAVDKNALVAQAVALGHERGFEFTPAEVEAELAKQAKGELTEAQLDATVGGVVAGAAASEADK